MSDLSANVTWNEILRETKEGNIPHCRAVAAPSKFHQEIIKALAEIILGSFREAHPDLLIIGSNDKAPDISMCRDLINDIALKPFEAEKRLGVVMNADKLLLPAANSLLKLSEEPPEHAYILFLMEDGRLLLPTLKSRSRFNVLIFNEQSESRQMPMNESEWIEWLEKSRKIDLDEIIKDIEAWANFETERKNFILAEIIERLKIIAAKKNLSVPVLCDIILMTLKEGKNYFECVLNDLWQA